MARGRRRSRTARSVDPRCASDRFSTTIKPIGVLGLTADDATAAAATATLAAHGYNPITSAAPQSLTAGIKLPAGAVTFLWTQTQTDPGGENQPPTHRNVVTATCNGEDVELAHSEAEGDIPTVEVRTIGDFALVALHTHIAREGEQAEHFSATVLDTKACTATKSVQ